MVLETVGAYDSTYLVGYCRVLLRYGDIQTYGFDCNATNVEIFISKLYYTEDPYLEE